MLYVADVQASGQVPPDNEIGGFLDSSGFCLVFSIRSSGHYRLIGLIPQELLGKSQLSFEHIKPFAERTTGVRVEKTFWSSVYHSHHRVVEHFRMGRVFIAGDAGHVHSPVGGQGMNTGIGDAVNLAWKLASVLQGRVDQSILDSYEPERITFARALVNTTDRFFNFVTGPGLRARIFRDLLFKRVVPLLLRSQSVRRKAFRIISQTRIHYRESPLSCGAVRSLHGGDRLPWVESFDNFAPLKSLDWQVHVYGQVSGAMREFGQQRSLPIHTFKWGKDAEDAGFDKNAMYLVRPDGHIALASKNQDVSKLIDYLDRLTIKSGVPVGYSPTT